MKIVLLISFNLFPFIFVNGQNKNDMITKIFFKEVLNEKRDVLLLPIMDSFTIKEIKKYLSKNMIRQRLTNYETRKKITKKIKFSNIEKVYIDSCINAAYTTNWTEDDLEKYELRNFKITKETKLFASNNIKYNILKPIFLRKYSICIFFSRYICGSLCGFGFLAIFKKQGNKWVNWISLYNSAS
jgi:hypothetical protein